MGRPDQKTAAQPQKTFPTVEEIVEDIFEAATESLGRKDDAPRTTGGVRRRIAPAFGAALH